MTEQQKKMAKIFNEWARRYSEDPKAFSAILDTDGKPVSDYGDCCALYFTKLESEIDAAGNFSSTVSSL